LNYIVLAPQVAPRNFKLTAVSPYCVSLSYDPVLYPNGPESGLVYQVHTQHISVLNCKFIIQAKTAKMLYIFFFSNVR